MRGTDGSAFAHRAAILLAAASLIGCGGASKTSPGAVAPPEPEPVPVAAPALTTPPPAEVSAQVRSTRAACGADAAKQGLDVVDFTTFNRLDENNWDATIRARRKGKLVRVGCRYDLRGGWTHIYEPAASDGGNPWGAAGPPKTTTAAGTTTGTSAPPAATGTAARPAAGSPASTAASQPKTASPAAAQPKPAPPAAAQPKPVPGAGIVMSSIADTTARSAIARTREACLAEAGRRKVAVDDFEAFRRVEGTVWEAMLVVKKARTSRSCRLDLATGKATIK